MSCVFIVLKYVLEVVACTAPRFWHRKCRYPRIRGFMPIPQVPQFPMYGFICIFIGPKYIPTYHPHTSNPQGPSQPRMYTPNPQCPLSAKCDRGSQHQLGGPRAFFDPPRPLCFWFSSVTDLKLTPSSQSGDM
jgi:hypothetical protein